LGWAQQFLQQGGPPGPPPAAVEEAATRAEAEEGQPQEDDNHRQPTAPTVAAAPGLSAEESVGNLLTRILRGGQGEQGGTADQVPSGGPSATQGNGLRTAIHAMPGADSAS